MHGLETLVDQQRPIRILTTFLKEGTLPHALLFTGIKGVGKESAALGFAMALNCEAKQPTEREGAGPCGICPSCRKIESGNHPDIIHIKPTGSLIRIARIRELCRTLALKPYEARMRVVIVSDARALNPEAGNAFLKVLEEPPDRTVLILITEQTSDLLPTIVSRCHRIQFRPISQKNLEGLLTEKTEITAQEAQALAGMANGSFSRALEMQKGDWVRKRSWIIREMETLGSEPVSVLLAFAEKLAADKAMLADTLDIMSGWLRDLAVYPSHPGKILNTDAESAIRHNAGTEPIHVLYTRAAAVWKSQKDIAAYANPRLTIERLLVELVRPPRMETA